MHAPVEAPRLVVKLPVAKTRVTSLIHGLQVRILPVRKVTVAQFGRAMECTVVAWFPGMD